MKTYVQDAGKQSTDKKVAQFVFTAQTADIKETVRIGRIEKLFFMFTEDQKQRKQKNL